MVLEGIVVDVLAKYLGDYIKDLNREQLKIGLFSGNVILKDLEVKGEALEQFNLPVNVKKGVLGKLELRVPWKNLKNQPVVVLLDNIFILAEKQNQFEYDEEEQLRRKKNAKRKKLDNYEALSEIKEEDKKDKKGKKFSSRLVTKIVDNLQILINKIHIRFEDEHEGKTYALGLTIDRISLQSTDEDWKPTFVDTVTSKILKLVELNDFSIYMNPNAKSLKGLPHTQFCDQFAALIHSAQSPGSHHYLIKPFSAWLKLSLSKPDSNDRTTPKFSLTSAMEELSFSLEEEQYHTLLGLVETVNFYVQETKYLRFRPKERPTKDPRGWWKYAGNVVLERVRERLNRKSWAYFLQRRRIRQEYIQLYKSYSGAKWHVPLTKPQAKRIEELEDQLSFEDIVFFRSLAKAELLKEAENAERRAEFKKLRKKKKGRLVAALLGSDDKKKKSKDKEKESSSTSSSAASTPKLPGTPQKKEADILPSTPELTKKQLKQQEKDQKKKDKELKKLLKKEVKNKGKATDEDASPITSPALLTSSIGTPKTDSLQLTKSEVDSDEDISDDEAPTILLSPTERQKLFETIGFDQALADVLEEKLPPEYIKTKMSFEVGRISFALVGEKPDKSVGTLATFAINNISLGIEKRIENMVLQATINNIEATDKLVGDSKFSRMISPSKTKNQRKGKPNGVEEEQFIQFRFEKNPLDGHCDLVIYAKMSPLDIVVNPSSVVRFYTFFRPPEPVAVWAIAGKGKRQWDDIKQRTRLQLMDVVKNKRSIDLTVDAKAPTILIPADPHRPDTVVAVADLGKILMSNEVREKITQSDDQYLDPDTISEKAFYDNFRFSVSAIRVMVTTADDEGWRDSTDLNAIYSEYAFVHTDVNLLLEKSIHPDEISLTQIKLSGELPALRVHFSTRKLGKLVQLANALDAQLAPLIASRQVGGFDTKSLLDTRTKVVKVAPDAIQKMDEMEILRERLLAQKQLEAKFSIGNVEVELNQSNAGGHDVLIAKLELSGLSLELEKQRYNMRGNIVLRAIQVHDFMTNYEGKFKNLVYSVDPTAPNIEDQALITGSFVKLDPSSPDFQGCFTTLTVDFNTLYVAVNPLPIQTILTLVNDCIEATTQLSPIVEAKAMQASTSTPLKDIVQSTSDRNLALAVASKLQIKANIKNLSVLLNDDGTHLATFSIRNIIADVDLKENKALALKGVVDSMDLIDETGVSGDPHSSIVSQKPGVSGPTIDFGFTIYPHPKLPSDFNPDEPPIGLNRLLSIRARHLQFGVYQSFFLKLLTFAQPLMELAPSRPVSNQKTHNSLISPFKIKGKKKQVVVVQDEKKRMGLDICVEEVQIFVPESDLSKTGIVLDLGLAQLENSFYLKKAQIPPESGEEEEATDVEMPAQKFSIRASEMALHIRYAKDGAETRHVTVIKGMKVVMSMDFLIGDVPAGFPVPSKRINIYIPEMEFLMLDPTQFGLVLQTSIGTSSFTAKLSTVRGRQRRGTITERTTPSLISPRAASTSPATSNPSSPSVTPRSITPSRSHLTLTRSATPKFLFTVQNRTVVKVEILTHHDGVPFVGFSLESATCAVDVRETRNVSVNGKTTNMQLFDLKRGPDGSIVQTLIGYPQNPNDDASVEYNVSKKKDGAAYVELHILPLHFLFNSDLLMRMFEFVDPLLLSLRNLKRDDNHAGPEPPVHAPPVLQRSNTARDLELRRTGRTSPATFTEDLPQVSSRLASPKPIRLDVARRDANANEKSQSPLTPRKGPPVPPIPPVSTPPTTTPIHHAAPSKKKSKFRLRIDSPVIEIFEGEMRGRALVLDLASMILFNGLATKTINKSPNKSSMDEADVDIESEMQVEQVQSLVIKASKLNARMCENAEEPSVLGNFIIKEADFDLDMETRDNSADRTATVPKRRLKLNSSELLFMLNQSDYDLVVSVLVAVLASLNHRKKEQHGSRDLESLVTEIFCDIPELQLAVSGGPKGEFNMALFRGNHINFTLQQYSTKNMKLDATLNSFHIIDTRPGICTEFSRVLHGKQEITQPMIKFSLTRKPADGSMAIGFVLDRPHIYGNIPAFLDILDFFLPTMTQKLLPGLAKDKGSASAKSSKKSTKIAIDITKAKLFVVEDFEKSSSGILVVKANVGMEYADRNRDVKLAMKLQQLKMGTIHHQISAQKAPVLHSATVDFVMSNSQGIAQSITVNLDTLPLFLSPQDIILVLTLVSKLRLSIPLMSAKFKNLRKEKDKKKDDEIEKQQFLMINCIGGIIITAMNDQIRLTQIEAHLSNWSKKQLQLEASMTLIAEYFNSSYMSFEPLIEKWPFTINMRQSENPKLRLSVESKSLFNLNVTHACGQMLISSYDVIDAISKQASSIFKKKKKPEADIDVVPPPDIVPDINVNPPVQQDPVSRLTIVPPNNSIPSYLRPSPSASSVNMPRSPSFGTTPGNPNVPAAPLIGAAAPIKKLVANFHPYWMWNQTGYTISYITEDSSSEATKLGDRLRFPMENVGKTTGRTRNFRQSEEENSLHIGVSVPQDGPLVRHIPIDSMGTHFFRANNQRLCCEVAWNDDGSKNVNLRSCVVLKNYTDLPLEFRVTDGKESRILGPQAPGESLAVPAQLAQQGLLMIRPVRGDFRTNDMLPLAELHEIISGKHKDPKGKAPGTPTRNTRVEELLDKTATANVESKLLEMMNKSGLTNVQVEKDETVTRYVTCLSPAKVPHLFVLQITRGPAFTNTPNEYQIFIDISAHSVHL